MAEVKILVEGYTSADNPDAEEKTCATIVLVRDKEFVIVTDPGVLEDQSILIRALKEEGLTVEDVNTIFLTHSHIDHYRNAGMFPNAKVIEYYGVWDKNTVDDRQNKLTEDIEIIETPGHNYTSITLLVKTEKGTIAIVGDVFWKENYPETDEYADNPEKLKETRKLVLEKADYIIPGHAGIYKVK
ncbi:MAG: MBL fold metallo-hydrolase [Candidatus Woesearchaeota archaeon]